VRGAKSRMGRNNRESEKFPSRKAEEFFIVGARGLQKRVKKPICRTHHERTRTRPEKRLRRNKERFKKPQLREGEKREMRVP